MAKHKKPTSEELEAKDKEIQEELEELKDKPESEVEEEQEEEQAEEEETEEEEPEVKEVEEEEEVKEPKKTEKPIEDLKKRYTESTREAQVLHSKLKAFEKASEIPEPTEKEMNSEYPDWEDMTEFEKKIAKNDWKQTKRNEATDAIVRQSKDVDKWNKQVAESIDDPQILIDNPALEGKLDDFQIFATKPTRRGADLQDLIKAFLFDVQTNKPAKKKGKMFETGSGGPSKKSKSGDKLSIEDGAKLKKANYAEYKRKLLAGKISDQI